MSFSTYSDWHTRKTGLTGESSYIFVIAHPDLPHQIKIITVLTRRCNYIDVRTDLLTGWGEWRVGQITGAADWFELRFPTSFQTNLIGARSDLFLSSGFHTIVLPMSIITSCRELFGRRA